MFYSEAFGETHLHGIDSVFFFLKHNDKGFLYGLPVGLNSGKICLVQDETFRIIIFHILVQRSTFDTDST